MLVLTRRVDESIMIGDDIRIVVVEVRGEQVKLGIEAPRNIPVHREEVYREIQEENRRAALAATGQIEELREALHKPEPPVSPEPRVSLQPPAPSEPPALEEASRVENQQPRHR